MHVCTTCLAGVVCTTVRYVGVREATALRRTGGDAVCCGGRAVGNIISENTKEEVSKKGYHCLRVRGVEAQGLDTVTELSEEGVCGGFIRAGCAERHPRPRAEPATSRRTRAAFALSAVRVCPD